MGRCWREHCWEKTPASRKSITLRVRVNPATAAMIEQLQSTIVRELDQSDKWKWRTTTRTTSDILRKAIKCLFNSPQERKWRSEQQKEVEVAKEQGMVLPAPAHIDGRTYRTLLLGDGKK